MKVEKELELEREGFRRTRRWIGDASQVKDLRWYRREMRQLSTADQAQGAIKQAVKSQSSPKAINSMLTRIFNMPSTQRQTARSES